MLIAQVEHADEEHLNAQVLLFASRKPVADASQKTLEACLHQLLVCSLCRDKIFTDAVPQMLLDKLDVNKLGITAISNVGAANCGWLVAHVHVHATTKAKVVTITLWQ